MIDNLKKDVSTERLEVKFDINIDWVDEFTEKIRPFVYVRPEDCLMILIPNQIYRLNRSGLGILNFMLKGGKIRELITLLNLNQRQIAEIHYFFADLRALIKGCFQESEKRRAVDYFEYKGNFNKLPVLSEIAVTYRCNLNCRFCYVGEKSDYRELSTAELKIVLRKIFFEAKVPSVSFTGGEPLLRKDILQIVKFARSLGLWTNLITNGTLIEREMARDLKRMGLNSSQVSIEGHNSEIHERLTGLAGTYTRTINGIECLREVGIPVHTNTTVTRENLAYLEEIVRLVKGLGLNRLSMNLLIPCGSASERKEIWVSYSEIGEHILRVQGLARALGIKFLWYSPVPLCKFNPIAHCLGNKSCAAVSGLLSIDPEGNILPCSSWPQPLGSLLKEPFQKIWNSVGAEYFKEHQYAPDICQGCELFPVCIGACPIYWQHRGADELKATVIDDGV